MNNMEAKFNLGEIRESVDLISVLRLLGYEPLRKSGGELFYRSMLRDNDSTPSFCLNERSGLWYDHGMGKGGSVIEFALAYWPDLSFADAITELLKLSGQLEGERVSRPPRPSQTSLSMREPTYLIREDKPLGTNPSITAYLKSRNIYQVASPYLKELYYTIKLQDNTRKDFFAAAWQNELGGWEVRNASFKGCLDKKAMSFIVGDESKINLFEGMMDFLSWKKCFPEDPASALILNTLSFLTPAIERAQHYPRVGLFFDHDKAGRKATAEVLAAVPHARDHSGLFAGYNDFNEKLQATSSQRKQFDQGLQRNKAGPNR